MISRTVILICAFIVHNTAGQSEISALNLIGEETNVDNLGIIGGHNVSIEEAPYMASLFSIRFNETMCGATIIHEKLVLTAAHCCILYEIELRVGSNDYSNGGQVFAAANMTIHANFFYEDADYDICIIKLNDTLKFGRTVDKIDLANDSVELNDGMELETLGWGLTKMDDGYSRSHQLLGVEIPLVSDCQEISTQRNLTSRMICAGATNKSAYHGDSGGPLTLDGIQVGISSFKTIPFDGVIVYTKVAALLPWILNTMNQLLNLE